MSTPNYTFCGGGWDGSVMVFETKALFDEHHERMAFKQQLKAQIESRFAFENISIKTLREAQKLLQINN